jgi:hypothetical protein
LPADNLATQISPNTNISEEALRSLRHRFERSKTAR